MRFGSLFSGIGGFDLGLERAGMECVWQVERDKQCCAVLSKRWPDVKRHDDVRTFDATESVRCDLICGGFPCQDLSVAGRRAGLAGERSGLFFDFMRIVGEQSPRWVLIENVPGLLSSSGGLDMGAVVGRLGQLGYGWAYRVLDAQWFGVAQRRRRVFLVGCLRNCRRAAEVLFERESLPWDSPKRRKTGQDVAHCIAAGVGNRFGSGRCGQEDDVVGTLNAHSKRHGHAMTTQQAEESGHLVAATLNSGGNQGGFRTEPGEHLVAHTLTAEGFDSSEDGTGSGVPLVPVCFQTRIARNGRGQPKEIADALTSCEGGTHADSKPHLAGSFGVRRLTPRECERLQGFSDDWTLVNDGRKPMSDSARYRMLGNAVVPAVAEWIGKRIMACEAEQSQ